MHDFITAKEMLDRVLRTARANQLVRVTRVEIALGRLEDHGQTIAPSNIRFNFRMLAKGTIAEKARLAISRIPGAVYRITAVEGIRSRKK